MRIQKLIKPLTSQIILHKTQRYIFMLLGAVFLLIGIIGIVLPVLPTTPFLLLTAACWARSSTRFHAWLLNHRWFGKPIRNWEENRVIPKKAKFLAWTMMAISCGMLFYRLPMAYQWVAWLSSGVCLATAVWMAKLPN